MEEQGVYEANNLACFNKSYESYKDEIVDVVLLGLYSSCCSYYQESIVGFLMSVSIL